MPSTIRIPAKRGRIRGVSAVAERTYQGRVYHSKAEAKQAAELDILVKAGKIRGWKPQAPFPITVNNEYICTVIVDFSVLCNEGTRYYIEIKGHETEIYRLKRKLLNACYPALDYRVVKV